MEGKENGIWEFGDWGESRWSDSRRISETERREKEGREREMRVQRWYRSGLVWGRDCGPENVGGRGR